MWPPLSHQFWVGTTHSQILCCYHSITNPVWVPLNHQFWMGTTQPPILGWFHSITNSVWGIFAMETEIQNGEHKMKFAIRARTSRAIKRAAKIDPAVCILCFHRKGTVASTSLNRQSWMGTTHQFWLTQLNHQSWVCTNQSPIFGGPLTNPGLIVPLNHESWVGTTQFNSGWASFSLILGGHHSVTNSGWAPLSQQFWVGTTQSTVTNPEWAPLNHRPGWAPLSHQF